VPTAYDTLTASELLAALEIADRLPDPDLIRACLERRAELTSGLLERLAQPGDPDWSFDDPRQMAQVHAALLLIAYREPAALPIFGELYRRPDALENNYVEWLDPELPAYGSAAIPMLRDLLYDSAAPETSRSSAVSMLASIARLHPETQPDILAMLRATLPPLDSDGKPSVADDEQPPELWTWVVAALADLCDTASRPQIVALYQADMIDEGIIGGLEDYQEHVDGEDEDPWVASHEPTDILEIYEQLRQFDAREAAMSAAFAERQARAEAQSQASAKILASAQSQRPPSSYGEVSSKPQTYVRAQPKVGRNEPCPCGSGRKYKHCHGKS
jgi:hypothetical protein